MEHRFTVPEDRKPALEQLIRSLPAMLAGKVPDVRGVAAGMKARVGWAFFSLVAPAFEEKGRGRTDDAGDSWAPLSPNYLAYKRPVTGRKPPKAGKFAPGGKDGYLTKEQLRRWRQIYAQSLHAFIMRESDEDAKRHAAAVAWYTLKKEGAKTKLGTFGKRQAGVDYQTLVDTGLLRRSLLPGEVHSQGYRGPKNQEYDDQGGRLVVGTLVPHAKYHHNAKDPKRRRRLWPKTLPKDWWRQIGDAAASGIVRIGELFGTGGTA